MNVLSLFDGISCGYLALKKSGFTDFNYFASEIDEKAIECSKRNNPDIIHIGDVTKLHYNKGVLHTEYGDYNVGKIDLLLGGSPCQGFSRAGKGLNFNDPRSKLFNDYMRLLNCIKIDNPNVLFLLENVVMKKEWMDVITNAIKCNPVKINSKLLSAQNRERLYWTNISINEIIDKKITLENIIDYSGNYNYDYYDKEKELIIKDGVTIYIKQATKSGRIKANEFDGINLTYPTSKSKRGRVIRGKSPCLTCNGDPSILQDGKIRHLTILEMERCQTLPDNYTLGFSDHARKKMIGNGWTVDVISHLLRGIENVEM